MTIVNAHFGKLNRVTIERKGTFVVEAVILLIAVKLCPPKNIHVGKVVSVIQKHIDDGRLDILREWHFLKLGDTQEKKVQTAVILLRNGKTYKNDISSDVLSAIRGKNLPKTTLSHYQKVVLIIYQTFNHFAETAIARNGNIEPNYFNIYENPELIKDTGLGAEI